MRGGMSTGIVVAGVNKGEAAPAHIQGLATLRSSQQASYSIKLTQGLKALGSKLTEWCLMADQGNSQAQQVQTLTPSLGQHPGWGSRVSVGSILTLHWI